jgi:hypothetical protein
VAGQHRAPEGPEEEEDVERAVRRAFLAGLVAGWALILLAWWIVVLAT